MPRRHFLKAGITQAGLFALMGSRSSIARATSKQIIDRVQSDTEGTSAIESNQRGDASHEASIFLASWRQPHRHSEHYAGLIRADWQRGVCSVERAVRLPGRPHGLNVLQDGSFLMVGVRPARWLMHWHENHQKLYESDDGMTLNGHAVASRDHSLVYCTESRRDDQRGYIMVRDAKHFEVIHRWPTEGIEPHQLLIDQRQRLWIAHGGIRRGTGDRKVELDAMASQLSCMDSRDGSILGQWSLPDRWLSMRHLAWAHTEAASGSSEFGDGLLGIAMQAEHPSATTRVHAPVLAVFSGDRIQTIGGGTEARGYGGDISAAPGGGFCVSSNRGRTLLWWHPQQTGDIKAIASIDEPYALCHRERDSTVYLACALGVARWNRQEAQMLAWPKPMMLDNHWVLRS